MVAVEFSKFLKDLGAVESREPIWSKGIDNKNAASIKTNIDNKQRTTRRGEPVHTFSIKIDLMKMFHDYNEHNTGDINAPLIPYGFS